MKSYKEMSQNAKNKRRSAPSGRIHSGSAKKTRTVVVECRYVGTSNTATELFESDYFSKDWRVYSRYVNQKAAESAIISLNKKEQDFEYRIPNII